jgi:hypothetical protein
MTGLQVANSYWVPLEASLGTERDPPVKTRFRELTVPIDVVAGGTTFRRRSCGRAGSRRRHPDHPHGHPRG